MILRTSSSNGSLINIVELIIAKIVSINNLLPMHGLSKSCCVRLHLLLWPLSILGQDLMTELGLLYILE